MSDVGKTRKNNEDNFVFCDLRTGEAGQAPARAEIPPHSPGWLWLVADGMGGEASGEVASQLCVLTVPQQLQQSLGASPPAGEADFVRRLRESLAVANQTIYRQAQSSAQQRRMGTTATAAALFGPSLFVAQVGDSRAYLERGNQLTQLTRDQTLLNYLRDMGLAGSAEPERDNRRNILTQAVGSSANLDVKVTYAALRQGDRLLLCSDGLYSMVGDSDILSVLKGPATLADKCRSLIAHANAAGGHDNITVVLVEFGGAGLPQADPSAPVECREFSET
jgi:protein phosphatase